LAKRDALGVIIRDSGRLPTRSGFYKAALLYPEPRLDDFRMPAVTGGGDEKRNDCLS